MSATRRSATPTRSPSGSTTGRRPNAATSSWLRVDDAAVERIADLPIYATDMLVRRADSLQLTADARPLLAQHLAATLATELGVPAGAMRAIQPRCRCRGRACRSPSMRRLAPRAVRIPAGLPATALLGAAFGALERRESLRPR